MIRGGTRFELQTKPTKAFLLYFTTPWALFSGRSYEKREIGSLSVHCAVYVLEALHTFFHLILTSSPVSLMPLNQILKKS